MRVATRELEAVYPALQRLAQVGTIPPGAEWLLDNHFVVRRASAMVRRGLSRGFTSRLPRALGRPGIRIERWAVMFLHGEARAIDRDTLAAASPRFSRDASATLAELWALPLFLRLDLLEQLGRDARVLVEPTVDPAVNRRVSDCVRSLMVLEKTDWSSFVERVSEVHEILTRDPSGHYANMDFETRDRYRRAIEELARRSSASEPELARRAIALARTLSPADGAPVHVGEVLLGPGRRALERELHVRGAGRLALARQLRSSAAPLYVGSILLVTLAHLSMLAVFLAAAGVPASLIVAAGVPATVLALTIGTSLISWVAALASSASVLPRMDFSAGVPAAHRTLVVVPGMLGRPEDTDALLARVEGHYLTWREPAVDFALLTDFRDAAQPTQPHDADLVERARLGIRELNERYREDGTGPFHLLHRHRVWNGHQGCHMGWERKRGKLEELNRLLRGDTTTTYTVHEGRDLDAGLRYVLTLDADTVLAPDSARRLVETLAHPLNRPRFDERTGRVVGGYTVLQPRVDIEPGSSATRFAWVFAGDGAYDIYSRASSDIYQDLMGEGIFVGKGLYDIDAFQRSVDGLMPENRILSHDLLEGVHGRAGLVSDVVVYEDYPANHLSYMRRLHRWVRGDWHLLAWLGRTVPIAQGHRARNRLSLLSRWKIFDNLRRSLEAPALFSFLTVGWLMLPGPAWLWTMLALVVLATPVLTELGGGVIRGGGPGGLRPAMSGAVDTAPTSVLRWILRTTALAHETVVCVDAAVRAVVRTTLTRRDELEWMPAALAGGGADRPRVILREMAPSGVLAGVLVLALCLHRPAALPAALPLLVAWIAAPGVAIWTGKPRCRHELAQPMGEVDTQQLRSLARRTWGYFEAMVGPGDHWLPPDHFQESPKGEVAHRTSPTNVGMGLLATLAAHDLGHVGLLELLVRLHDTLHTIEHIPGHRGHMLNWYDTTSLVALEPRYVSTVDSGNLVAALLVIESASRELSREAIPLEHRFSGMRDTLAVLDEALSTHVGDVTPLRSVTASMADRLRAVSDAPLQWLPTLDHLLSADCGELDEQLLALYATDGVRDAAAFEELRRWAVAVSEGLEGTRREITTLLPWLDLLMHAPTDAASADTVDRVRDALLPLPRLAQVAERYGAARALAEKAADEAHRRGDTGTAAWARALGKTVQEGVDVIAQARRRLEDVAETAGALVARTDFTFLYDPSRSLFFIGYDVSAARHDEHHYDLLASEARLASLVAIAKGDVPAKHWAKLGRPIGRFGGSQGLLSWSGTMFEYLMPPLVLDEGRHTLLDVTARAAVQAQIAYGRSQGVAWGISESGYARVDADQNYQYRAFGVPTTGFRRGLDRDLVIAPYASLIALRFAPGAVMENLGRLRSEGAFGPHGAYEALDYTSGGGRRRARPRVVQSYMSHHQGMILLALDGFLTDGAMVRRMHRHPLIRSSEFLLRERAPSRIAVERAQPAEEGAHVSAPEGAIGGWDPVEAEYTQAHLVAHGEYATVVTARGGGHSRWRGTALTRPCLDPTLDDASIAMYIREENDGRVWSSSIGRDTNSTSGVVFHPGGVAYPLQYDGLTGELGVSVVDGSAEIRLLRLAERGGHARRLSIFGYVELALDDALARARHPAFSRLFVECEVLDDPASVVCHRRRRSPEDEDVWLACALVASRGRLCGVETARERFLGRGRSRRSPAFGVEPFPTGGAPRHAPLDPCVGLQLRVDLPAGAELECALILAAGKTRGSVLASLARLRSPAAIRRAVREAHADATEAVRSANRDTDSLRREQRLVSAISFPRPALRASREVLLRNRLGQSRLWRHGISGDLPLVVVRVASEETTALVRELIGAHRRCHAAGAPFDLVLLEEQAATYSATVRERLLALIEQLGGRLAAPHGGVFPVGGRHLDPAERDLLLAAARIVVDADASDLDERLGLPDPRVPLPRFEPPGQARAPTPVLPPTTGVRLNNGFGGFSECGREYIIDLAPADATPAPWVNVLANPSFGAVLSERGGGYTFARNAARNRLTPWANDTALDPPSEALYLRDEVDGRVWSPLPAPAPGNGAYRVRHGAGYSVFEHHGHGLAQRVEIFVAPHDPVKVIRLEVKDLWGRPRRVTATLFIEWLLGARRETDAPFVVTEFDADRDVLLAHNPWNEPFAGDWAFAAASRALHGLTTDRSEFLGHGGDRARPVALERIGLSGDVGPGTDPCAALQVHLDLDAGEATTLHFVLGQAKGRGPAVELAHRYRDPKHVARARAAVDEDWNRRLSAVRIRTPNPGLDVLVNRWWPYQCVASRLWARTGHYQSGGAFGFRDQLQDVMALLHAEPALARSHILEAARHQFPEGDVLHWWHPPDDSGLRSRCSDDLLWLPLATAEYVEATGDRSILDEVVAFVSAPELLPDEHERYQPSFDPGGEADLFEHCLRALARGTTAGAHGLPLIGSSDWNDGFSHLGLRGRGESVWLGWFLHFVHARFASLCENVGRHDQARALRQRADGLVAAIEASWDGAWYRRAYDDDGQPIGSHASEACQIDSIAQSWAVLSGAGSPERARRAMDSLWDRLVDEDHGLVRLFAPSFDSVSPTVGYISGYPPGVRENGGQYTHAAIWAAWAFADLGQVDRAVRIVEMISPLRHAGSREDAARYRVEPYVIAADVYADPPHRGRGGWTWYTGSAAWAQRLVVEKILGVRRSGGRIRIDPHLPSHWPEATVFVRDGDQTHEIRIQRRGPGHDAVSARVDGVARELPVVLPPPDGADHLVEIEISRAQDMIDGGDAGG